MARLQGQTRRGYLHELALSRMFGLRMDIRFWLEAHDSPYCKLHYTDDAGVRWSFRMKNR